MPARADDRGSEAVDADAPSQALKRFRRGREASRAHSWSKSKSEAAAGIRRSVSFPFYKYHFGLAISTQVSESALFDLRVSESALFDLREDFFA